MSRTEGCARVKKVALRENPTLLSGQFINVCRPWLTVEWTNEKINNQREMPSKLIYHWMSSVHIDACELKSPTTNDVHSELDNLRNLSSIQWPKAVEAFYRPFISFRQWINGFPNDIFPSMGIGSMDSWILLINFHWKFMGELNWLTCRSQSSLFQSA